MEDKEWKDAEAKDEPEMYFKCTMPDGTYYFKWYKPSMAKLVARRTGMHLSPVETLIC